MLNSFDSRLVQELQAAIAAEKEDFHLQVSSAEDFAQVKYLLGYHEALDNVSQLVNEIEARLVSGEDQ
jgi:hypothetical protein